MHRKIALLVLLGRLLGLPTYTERDTPSWLTTDDPRRGRYFEPRPGPRSRGPESRLGKAIHGPVPGVLARGRSSRLCGKVLTT
jgi:hypothetical protein